GDGLILDLGYRYLDMGDITVKMDRYRTNWENPSNYESYREIGEHELPSRISEVSFGIRLAF
ncbi:MAG: hypothetical protein JXR30_00560, partial [Alphaproteobacteria bacterium]|nr:hypothetical protein [Alphaproteobacteria bacterium]